MSMTEEEEAKLTKLHNEFVAAGAQGVDPVHTYHQKLFDAEVLKLTKILNDRIAPCMKDIVRPFFCFLFLVLFDLLYL